MKEEKSLTTIQIYRDDNEYINNICKKRENLRNKLKEIINFYKNTHKSHSTNKLRSPLLPIQEYLQNR